VITIIGSLPSEHAPLDTLNALSDWATAIANEAHGVDIDSPPRGEEWDKILKLTPSQRLQGGLYRTPQPYRMPDIHMDYPERSPRRSPRQHSSRRDYSSRSPRRSSPYPSTHTPAAAPTIFTHSI
jgi:hypothetical protein